jgi:hypothetical protein
MRINHRIVRRGIALSLLLAAIAGCRTRSATLADIGGVAELQNQFNRDAGSIRIVLLMSPT